MAKFVPLTDTLLERLDDRGNVCRLEEFLDGLDSLPVRKTLDRLEIDGEIDRFPVGDHIMVRRAADE